jgi:hypothetical protein
MPKTNAENLLIDGRPKYIRCYVSKKALKEGCPDAWTIVFTKLNCWVAADRKVKNMYLGKVWYIGMTQGGLIYHGEADRDKFCPGTPVSYESLTLGQKEAVIAEYEACWDVTITHVNGHCAKIWRNVKETA